MMETSENTASASGGMPASRRASHADFISSWESMHMTLTSWRSVLNAAPVSSALIGEVAGVLIGMDVRAWSSWRGFPACKRRGGSACGEGRAASGRRACRVFRTTGSAPRGVRQNSTNACATSGCGAPFRHADWDPRSAWCRPPARSRPARGVPDALVSSSAIRAAVEIDAHAGGGVALADVQRDLRGAVGEIAGVGGESLDQPQAGGPAGFERGLAVDRVFRERAQDFRLGLTTRTRGRPSRFWWDPPGRGYPRIAGSPRSRHAVGEGSLRRSEDIRVITDPKLRHAGAHPDVIRRIVALAGEGFRDRAAFAQTARDAFRKPAAERGGPFSPGRKNPVRRRRKTDPRRCLRVRFPPRPCIRRRAPCGFPRCRPASANRRESCGRWSISNRPRMPRRIPGGSIRCGV